jgi:hypothetical protein
MRDRPLRPRGPFVCACNGGGRGANGPPMVIDGLQYANWSEKVFRQMREGGVDAVHVTIAYHEMFRETVANIEAWNRRFERFPDLICHAKTGDDIRRAKDRGAHRHRLRRPDARAHRGRYRPGGDPAHARPALHAAQLQQPVPARDRLLRGGGPGPHPHGARGHRRDEPRGPCRGHEPFRRTLHAGGDGGEPKAHRDHPRQSRLLAPGGATSPTRSCGRWPKPAACWAFRFIPTT